MLYELQCTPRVGNSFQIVALAMGKVVHGVGVPLVASADMGNVEYTVNQRIAEQHIRMRHVYLSTKHQRTRLALTAVHKLKQLQVLLYWTIAERTVCTRTGGGTLLLGNHLRALLVYISTALFDKPNGKVPEFLEVVAGIVDVGPLESQPLDIVLNAFNIFCIFLDGVCVIETQIALTTIFLGQTEVDSNSLGMSDVQITIGFRWKTGLHSAAVLTLCQVVDHLLFNEAN